MASQKNPIQYSTSHGLSEALDNCEAIVERSDNGFQRVKPFEWSDNRFIGFQRAKPFGRSPLPSENKIIN